MQMAISTDDIYGRVYVDCKLKVFCYTSVPLKRPTHQPIVAAERHLIDLKKSLLAKGYTPMNRALFESQFR